MVAAPLLPATPADAPRWLLPVVCSAAFMVFTQTFMVAPLLPRLAAIFGSPIGWVALAIPAYVVPQAIATLCSGPLSDRLGRRGVILGSLCVFSQTVALMAFSLFTGFGVGSLVFQGALALGFASAFTLFGLAALVAAGVALVWFRGEHPAAAPHAQA